MFRNLTPNAIGIKADLASTIKLAKADGWQGIDLPIVEALKIAKTQSIEIVQQQLSESGLRLGGWGLPFDWRQDYGQDALDTLAEQAALAQSLGCTRVYTWVPPASSDKTYREQFAFCVRQLQPIARVLAEHGCRFALESIGPRTLRTDQQYGFIYTFAGMLGLCQAVGENAGLLVDSYHWYTSLGTLSDLRALSANEIVYVHVNDAPSGVAVADQLDQVRRLPSTTGVIDLAGFLQTLRDCGYDGPVTPEPFEPHLAKQSAEESSREAHDSMLAMWQLAGLN